MIQFLRFLGKLNHKTLFYALLVVFPLNLSKHFITPDHFIDGILIDYLIPTVYLTDILIGILLLLWGISLLDKINKKLFFDDLFKKFPRDLTMFVILSGVSTLVSPYEPSSLFRVIKLGMFVMLFWYISKNINMKEDLNRVVIFLSVPLLLESILGILQFVKQESIFGYFPFGGPVFTSGTPQIAKAGFYGVSKVLPYGTFPHPNVLGGVFSIVLLLIFFHLFINFKTLNKVVVRYLLLVGCLGTAVLFLTRSNSAILSLAAGGLCLMLLGRKNKKRILFLMSTTLLMLIFIILYAPLNFSAGSFSQRIDLNNISFRMIKDNPWLGVGLGKFTAALVQYGTVSGFVKIIQPVHNIFLLITAETGIIASLMFISFLYGVFLYNNARLKQGGGQSVFGVLVLSLFLQIIILGLFDHYLFSIQQGILVFWIICGLANSYNSVVKSNQL